MGKKIIAVWAFLGIAIITASYLFTYQEKMKFNLDRVAHTHETLSLIYDLQNNLARTEALTRGYVITGEEDQLERYQEATGKIEYILNQLDQVAVEPEQQALLGSLKPLISKRQVLFNKSIDLRRTKGFEGPELAAIAKDGKKVNDNIRKILNKLEYSEKKLLAPQWAAEKKRTRFWLRVLTFGTFLSLSLFLPMLYLLSREITERRRAEEQLVMHQEDLRNLASQLTLAEERERRRIAVNLHDQIGQTLAISNIKLAELRKCIPSGNDYLVTELDKIRELMEQSIHDTQSLTLKISPPILYELGLEAALEWLTEQLPKQQGISTHFECDEQPKPLDDDIRILLFQAVGELLVNVVKHAQAHNLKVCLWREGAHVWVSVEDDGVGFKVADLGNRRRAHGGFGLFSIRERLKPFNGLLEVSSSPGAGTKIILSVPLKHDPQIS